MYNLLIFLLHLHRNISKNVLILTKTLYMEKNKSKQSGLFQSVASKLSRFFKRESSEPVSNPVSAPEPQPEVAPATEPEPSAIVAEPQAPIAPEAPAAPAEPVPPIPDEVSPIIEEEKSTKPEPKPIEKPIVDIEPKVLVEKTVEPKPAPEVRRHEPVAPRQTSMPTPPVSEAEPAQTPKEPVASVSITELTTKRRLHISDLSREEAEALLSSYVQEHLSDEQLSVETMAVELKISRTGLYQLVHDIFDVTPANYILDCRLKYASELLRMGRKVREVSSKCGFSDPKYFSKVFKKYYGVLPSNYGAAE